MVKRIDHHQTGIIVFIIVMMQLTNQVTSLIDCTNNLSGSKPDRYYKLPEAKCIATDAACEPGYATLLVTDPSTYDCDGCAPGYMMN